MMLYKEFNKLSLILKLILLIIPGVNWVTEVVVCSSLERSIK